MKRIIFGIFILLAAIACKPRSERDDAKYLGTWKSNPVLDNGTYNYVKIELSGNDEFPYRLTPGQFSGSVKKTMNLEIKGIKYVMVV